MESLSKIMEKYNYSKSDKTIGSSFAYGCSFYETEFDSVFITNYDIGSDCILGDNILLAFSDKTRKLIKFSIELLIDYPDAVKFELKKLTIK